MSQFLGAEEVRQQNGGERHKGGDGDAEYRRDTRHGRIRGAERIEGNGNSANDGGKRVDVKTRNSLVVGDDSEEYPTDGVRSAADGE